MIMHEGYWVGLFLTIKDIKAFCQIKKEGDVFTITPNMLEEGTRVADFNFFLLHPTTGRGLYQHYHQSPAPNTFCAFAKKRYDELKDQKIDTEILNAEGRGISDKDERNIRKTYKGSLKFSTLLKQDSFEKSVQALKEVTFFELELATYGTKEKDFLPISPYATRMKHKVFFDRKSNTAMVKERILETLSMGLRSGKVKGVDPEGNQAVYKLLNDYAAFANYDYNDLITTIHINSSDLVSSVRSSKLISELVRLSKIPQLDALLSTRAK
ncbi:MAG: hypothetical protein AB9873_17740 [Syntrophobacteraceae bacterium]